MRTSLEQELNAVTTRGGQEMSDMMFIEAAYRAYVRGGRSASNFRQLETVTPEHALSRGELAALESVGLMLDDALRRDADKARQESLHVFFRVLETALSTTEVASLLKVSPSRIRQRAKDRSLVTIVNDGERRFPALQFHAGRELPGLRQVLAALPKQAPPLTTLSWFATPTGELEGDTGRSRSPREYLLETGDTAAVVAAAAALSDS